MAKLSLRERVLLAAPHTWSASVMPSLFSMAYAARGGGRPDITAGVLTLLISVLLQSAVNTFNDYADFVKGTDTGENSPDAYDAVIVHNADTRGALITGIVYFASAAVPGICAVLLYGTGLLWIGAAGGAAVLLYSFGRRPVSYLPAGELVSSFVMGGLIPLAGCYMQSGTADPAVLLYSTPLMLGTALIMYSNNACDMRRDRAAGRKTLPLLLGPERAVRLYRLLLPARPVLTLILLASGMGIGAALVYAAALPLEGTAVCRQLRLTPDEESRAGVMNGIVSLNTLSGFAYMLAMTVGGA